MKEKIVNIEPLIFSISTCIKQGKNIITLKDIKEVLEEMDEYQPKNCSWLFNRTFRYASGEVETEYKCSNCGKFCSDVYEREYKYCPYCGCRAKA